MASRKRNRGNWQYLTVQWRIALPHSAAKLSKNDQARLRLTAFLDALELGTMPTWARISYLAWQNPDADHEPEPIIDDNESALENLPTLNKGGWLSRKVRDDLDGIGGPLRYERQHTGKRKKRKRPSKKVANLAKRKGKRVGQKRRKATSRSGKRKVQKMGHHRRTMGARKDHGRH